MSGRGSFIKFDIKFCCVGSGIWGKIKNWCGYAIRTIKDEEHDVFVDFAFLNIF